ncbi:MAG: aspartyl/asparaginyl beta-hydroxylase domain-containing protein [Janthinobacterium lividum]
MDCAGCGTDLLDLTSGMSTAFFSIVAPGKVLPAHRGPYNGVLGYHLGLRIPVSDERCAIRVDNQTRILSKRSA